MTGKYYKTSFMIYMIHTFFEDNTPHFVKSVNHINFFENYITRNSI